MRLKNLLEILPPKQDTELCGITEIRKIINEYQTKYQQSTESDEQENPDELPSDILFRLLEVFLQAEHEKDYLPEQVILPIGDGEYSSQRLRSLFIYRFGKVFYKNCKRLSAAGLLTARIFRAAPVKNDANTIRLICSLKEKGIANMKVFHAMLDNNKQSEILYGVFYLLFLLNILNEETINAVAHTPHIGITLLRFMRDTDHLLHFNQDNILVKVLFNNIHMGTAVIRCLTTIIECKIDKPQNRQKLYQNIADADYITYILNLFTTSNIKIDQNLFEIIIEYYLIAKHKDFNLSRYLSLNSETRKLCKYLLPESEQSNPDIIDKIESSFVSDCAITIFVNSEFADEISETMNLIYYYTKSGVYSDDDFKFFLKLFGTPLTFIDALHNTLQDTMQSFNQQINAEYNFSKFILALQKVGNDYSHLLLGAIYSTTSWGLEDFYNPIAASYYFLLIRKDGIWKRLAIEGLYHLYSSEMCIHIDEQQINSQDSQDEPLVELTKIEGLQKKGTTEDCDNDNNTDHPSIADGHKLIKADIERQRMLVWLAERKSELGIKFRNHIAKMQGRPNYPLFFPFPVKLERNMVATTNDLILTEKIRAKVIEDSPQPLVRKNAG